MRALLILALPLLILAGPLSGQDKRASVLLSSAIYEEEVSGNLDKAIELYLDIIKTYPDDRPVAAKALYHLGLVNEKLGKQKADEYYSRLIKSYPEQHEWVTLAQAKLSQLNAGVAGKKAEAELHYSRAGKFLDQWEYQNSIKEFEDVIRLVPETDLALESRYWIGQAYFRTGDFSKSMGVFKALLRDYPDRSIAPVCQLMVSQIEADIRNGKTKTLSSSSTDGWVFVPGDSVKYQLVKSFTGSCEEKIRNGIHGVSPSGSFFLSANYIIPTDNSEPEKLYEIPSSWEMQASSLSPDGTQVAFFDIDTLKLLSISPETGHPISKPETIFAEDGQPVKGRYVKWSPDGTNIAFVRGTDFNTGDIWTLTLKDKKITRVTDTPEVEWMPIYTQDGSRIYYSSGKYPRYIMWSSKLDGGDRKKVIEDVPNFWSSVFLTQDEKLLFYPGAGSVNLIHLQNQINYQAVIPEEIGNLSYWVPNSDRLLFMRSSIESYASIKVISSAGGPPCEIGGSIGRASGLISWTPDSRNIVSSTGKMISSPSSIEVFPVNGDQPLKINQEFSGSFRAISPDCSKTAELILNQGSYTFDLVISPISVSEGRLTGPQVTASSNIPARSRRIRSLYWSPTLQEIAISYNGDILIYPLNGGSPRNITKSNLCQGIYAYSPDGTMIVAAFSEDSKSLMKIIRTDDGSEILRIPGGYGGKWSPDGKELAAISENGNISVYSVGTGARREVVNWSAMGLYTVSTLVWSPDGKKILFEGNYISDKDSYHLFWVYSTGGTPSDFNLEDTGVKTSISWSPDGKWVAYLTNLKQKVRLETTLWEASLKDFIKKAAPPAPPVLVSPEGSFTDLRDGHSYGYRKFGSQTWMTENLAYLPCVSPVSTGSRTDSHFYVYGYSLQDTADAKSTSNYKTFGVLYNWPAAMNGEKSSNSIPSGVRGICPDGWHLPSDEEWMVLEQYLGMSAEEAKKTGGRISGNVGYKIQAPYGSYYQTEGWTGCNSSGFNSLPGGYRNPAESTEYYSYYLYKHSYYLTCTEADSLSTYNRIIVYLQFGIYRMPIEKMKGYSIRCVRDN